jgi:phosphoribosylformimino-5-aminoimidazole carboxamide ribotide isomerase
MEIIPAIDLMDETIVRLRKGEFHTAQRYKSFRSPLDVAKKWEMEGAHYLHIIDLDAARGVGNNRQIILKILHEVRIPVQIGGGIRNQTIVEQLLNGGASRVILATLAFEKNDELTMLLEKFGREKIMVALDYRQGMVMMRGWKESTGLTLNEAIEKFSNLGVELFLLTSIARDGLLTGPDYITLKNAAKQVTQGLFMAGGVSSLADLIKLKTSGVDGVIIGKALYEKKFTLEEALEVGKRRDDNTN